MDVPNLGCLNVATVVCWNQIILTLRTAVMSSAQKEIMNTYVFGYTPGPPAVMIASAWIEYIVLTEQTEFSKWFDFHTFGDHIMGCSDWFSDNAHAVGSIFCWIVRNLDYTSYEFGCDHCFVESRRC